MMPWAAITDPAVVSVLTVAGAAAAAAMALLAGNAVYMLTGVVGKAARKRSCTQTSIYLQIYRENLIYCDIFVRRVGAQVFVHLCDVINSVPIFDGLARRV